MRQDPSRVSFANRFLLTRESIEWFARQYHGHSEPELHPDASPARAARLDGLAPAWIVTAELDHDTAHHIGEEVGLPGRADAWVAQAKALTAEAE